MVKGIDVSVYQGTIHWNLVKKSGIAFAFAKASEGIALKDPNFSANWYGMEDADIYHGAYHYFGSQKDSGKAQAQNFLEALDGKSYGNLPPVLDFEKCLIEPSVLVQEAQVWLQTVEEALKVKPLVYTNPSFGNSTIQGALSDYDLWVANYEVSQPSIPAGWNQWTFWQYSDTGSVNGIEGYVDLDQFNGSWEALQQYVRQQKHSGDVENVESEVPSASPEKTCVVEPGDTLTSIGQRFGVSVSALAEYNHIADPNLIQVGQILRIP